MGSAVIQPPLEDWAWAQTVVRFTERLPLRELVQGVRAVAFMPDGRVVVCTDEAGERFLPGGTREDGESPEDCFRRELAEETGLQVTSAPCWFAAHVGVSYHDVPYRPHSPFPLKAWLWGHTQVDGIGRPRDTRSGEVVVSVEPLPIDTALAVLRDSRRGCATALRSVVGRPP